MKSTNNFKLKFISVVLSVLMLVPYMTGFAVAVDTAVQTQVQEVTPSRVTPTEITADNSVSTEIVRDSVVPDLPEALDISTVPEAVGVAKAQLSGHILRAYDKEQNLNTVSFYNTDGTRTEYIFDYPVKYVDTDGKTKDITLDIKANGIMAGFISKDTLTETTFSYKFTDGIELSGEGISVKLIPVFDNISNVIIPSTPVTPELELASRAVAKVSPIAELQADSKSVIYTLDSKTSYEYSLVYSGFKENIVVSEYTGQTEYTFKLYTNGLTLTQDNGDFYLCDSEGNVKGNLGRVIVFTADWQNNTYGTMTAEAVTENQEYILTIQLDAQYLNDEATLYPITIDPTITLNYANDNDGIQDIVINSVDVLSGTDGEISAGKWGSDQSISRILMKFPGLNMNNIASAEAIQSAKVYIHDLMCQHEELSLECYVFTGNTWSESNASWSNVGTTSFASGYYLDTHAISYYEGLEQTVSQEYGFDITDALRGWKIGSFSQAKGIIFKASNANEQSTAHNYKTFASFQRANYKPYLVVEYGVIGTLPSGVYILKNVELNEYMQVNDANPTSIGSTYELDSFNGSDEQLWQIDNVYGSIYRIFSVESGLAVTAPTLAGGNLTQTVYEDNTRQMWLISAVGNRMYKISSLFDTSCYMSVGTSSSGEETVNMGAEQTDNSDEWYLYEYTAIVNNYFDNGYSVYYNESTNNSITKINSYLKSVTGRYCELLSLYIVIESPTYYNSPIDVCKGTVSSSNIDMLCTHSGTEHTLRGNVISNFNNTHQGSNISTNVFWTCHKIKSTATNGDTNYNRSCSSGTSVFMLERSTSSNRSIDSKGVLMHELNHQFGAIDHYHELADTNDPSSCKFKDVCFECGGANARPQTCIMNNSRQDIYSDDIICSECKNDILQHLISHH